MKARQMGPGDYVLVVLFAIIVGIFFFIINISPPPESSIPLPKTAFNDDGALAFFDPVTGQQLALKPCDTPNRKPCPSEATGFKKIGETKEEILFTLWQRSGGSVTCCLEGSTASIPGSSGTSCYYDPNRNTCRRGYEPVP